MKRLLILILCLLLFYGPAFAANCGGVTVCNCGDTVTSSYTLTGNLSCTNAGAALTTSTNGITIDLGGYTIDGDDINTTIGIRVTGGTGITIKNGTITDFAVSGLSVEGSSTGTVQNLTCNSSVDQGFQNLGTAQWAYNNITANTNGDDGFSMHDDSVATINTGSFNGNAQCINLVHDAHLTGTNIDCSGSTDKDLYATDDETATHGPVITITGYTGNRPSVAAYKGTINLNRFYIHDVPATHGIDTQVVAGYPGHVNLNYGIIEDTASTKFGVAVRTGSISTINNVVFVDGIETGKGIYTTASVTPTNCIFDNLVVGITKANGTVVALNCLFYANTANTSGTVTVGATNKVDVDPLFMPGTYQLSSRSPAINAGTLITGIHDQATAATDYSGTSIYTLPDIGAYEYTDQNLYFDSSASTGGTGTVAYPYHLFADYPSWAGYAVRSGSTMYIKGTFASGDALDISSLSDAPLRLSPRGSHAATFYLTGGGANVPITLNKRQFFVDSLGLFIR